ncbi:cation acetate symporter [Rhizorhabdus wittichii]|uniref:Cation acetate symporter n=1 Tax=Rhizorhabdus wittichii TaxID=160791 RepID=A0A975D1R5_9SPHN|nr:hypothetical protein [Rhizorhabdus wittichii]QTH20125.1 cation acetate symporter [Rhizorhabdus wittichii]
MNNLTAITAFLAVIALSAGVIAWAARRNRSVSSYYTAGGSLSPWQNGLALAGDFISAGGFLGLTGLVAARGLDAAVYAIGVLASWPLMLLLFAGPLQRLGKYTLADVLTGVLGSSRLRIVTAGNQIVILLLGLTANLVGSLLILQLLFSLSAVPALLLIGALMLAYVVLGGMSAATWLQIIKASLLMAAMIAILLLTLSHFDFSLDALLAAVAGQGKGDALVPSGMYAGGFDTVSLLTGLALGGASMPHVLMRMNTVASPAAARKSAFLATVVVALFHVILVVVGLGASVLLSPAETGASGGNMTLPLLGGMLGGQAMLGFVAAIAIMTMLAVMAGQCIAGSAAIAHDIWANALGREAGGRGRGSLVANRVASVMLLGVALLLAYGLKGQNISFIAATAMAIAASANFPVLFLAIFWKKLTARGAVSGIVTGLISSAILIFLGPLVQTGLLGRAESILELRHPAIFSMPLALIAALTGSLIPGPSIGRPSPDDGSRLLSTSAIMAAGSYILLVVFGLIVGAPPFWLTESVIFHVTGYAVLLAGAALIVPLIAAGYILTASRSGGISRDLDGGAPDICRPSGWRQYN